MVHNVVNLLCVLFIVSCVKSQSNKTDKNIDALIQDYDYIGDYDSLIDEIENNPIADSIDQTKQDDYDLLFGDYGTKSNITTHLDEDFQNEATTQTSLENTEDESSTTSQEEIDLDYEEIKVIHSPGYPNGYPNNSSWTWILLAGTGYGLEINVTDVDLNMIDSDYLIINPGGGESNEDSLLFSGYLVEPRRYRILDYDTMSIHFVSSYKADNTELHRGFNISVKHIGITTTVETTTIDPIPEWIQTPVENHTIYLSGKTPHQFLEVSESFHLTLVDMVYNYIDVNDVSIGGNMTIESNITVEERVRFEVVRACNLNWPNSDTCVSVTYSVPLYFNASTGEYQMTRENMTSMWNILVETDHYKEMLMKDGLSVYHMPNDNAVLTWWMAVSLGVILAMLVITYIIWRLNCFDEYTRMSRMSVSENHITKKISDSSLYPPPHQTIPPLFGLESYDSEWMDQSIPPNYTYNSDAHAENKSNLGANSGYDNKSFVRDENLFFEMDSDEEVVMSLPNKLSKNGSRIPRESTF